MSALKITKDNFETEVLSSEIPVLVDFWAEWCPPCRALAPTIDEIAAETDGKAKIGKINVDEQPELAMQFNVVNIPTIIIFKNGKAENTVVGTRGKVELLALLS